MVEFFFIILYFIHKISDVFLFDFLTVMVCIDGFIR